MWIFTKYGFFSAVCARKGDGKQGRALDENRIMVRARNDGHLLALQARFPELLKEQKVLRSDDTDYAFRILVDRQVWSQVAAGLADETDYGNFKSEVAHHQGREGAAYEHALHDVWSVMYRLQK